jgi:adenine-specific DNA-methyltransferase
MKKLTAGDPETMSPDLVAENLQRLMALFPELVTEGPEGTLVNVDVLKQLVGDKSIAEADEKYGLNWHGKREARHLALTPSTGTLRPCQEDSVNWDTTQNLMIEGDNLEALKLLQKSYSGKVKLIYIDPPYNTGKDFVYPDNFADSISNYLELTNQIDGGRRISSNTESSGRFHTKWLNMLYPRLALARNMLREDGLIFISIDDNELAHLTLLCNEVFGESNYVNTIIWHYGKMSNETSKLPNNHEYVLVYRRSPLGGIFEKVKKEDSEYRNRYIRFVTPENTVTYGSVKNSSDNLVLLRVKKVKELLRKEILDDNDILFDFNVEFKSHSDVIYASTIKGNSDENVKDFDTGQKPLALMDLLLRFGAPEKDAIILDFFAGSGSTAHAVLNLNKEDNGERRFLLVQIPEPIQASNKGTIADITKRRLRRVGQKIYAENQLMSIDTGFRVFKLDSSSIRVWEPDKENLDQTILDYTDHIKKDRTEQDILYELLLKLGLDLCMPIEQKELAGKIVYSIGCGVLIACLASLINRKDVEALSQGIVAWRQASAPAGDTTCVFLDSAFVDDVAKTNLAAILNQHGFNNMRSL